MSEWCEDDVSTGDTQWMSRVMYRGKWQSGFYSVGDRATEVFPDLMKDRNNRRVSWRVESTEVMCYGEYEVGWRTGLLGLLGKGDSRSWKAVEDTNDFQERKRNSSKDDD